MAELRALSAEKQFKVLVAPLRACYSPTEIYSLISAIQANRFGDITFTPATLAQYIQDFDADNAQRLTLGMLTRFNNDTEARLRTLQVFASCMMAYALGLEISPRLLGFAEAGLEDKTALILDAGTELTKFQFKLLWESVVGALEETVGVDLEELLKKSLAGGAFFSEVRHSLVRGDDMGVFDTEYINRMHAFAEVSID